MGVTPDRARILANYARDRRGWDEAGSMAALKPCARMAEDDVAMAWVRFCADPNVRTPGAFPTTTGPHWSEKRVGVALAPQPPRVGENCRICGRHVERCICSLRVPDETGAKEPTTRPLPKSDPTDEYRAAREAIARNAPNLTPKETP